MGIPHFLPQTAFTGTVDLTRRQGNATDSGIIGLTQVHACHELSRGRAASKKIHAMPRSGSGEDRTISVNVMEAHFVR